MCLQFTNFRITELFFLNLRQYYFDMNNSEKRASAIYKYDRLEDILSSKPSKKNLELLLNQFNIYLVFYDNRSIYTVSFLYKTTINE